MKESFLGCMPGFGGTSTLPAAFSKKAFSTIRTISFIGRSSVSTSALERYKTSSNEFMIHTTHGQMGMVLDDAVNQPPPTGGMIARTSPFESFVFNPSKDNTFLPLTSNCRKLLTSPVFLS